MRIFAGKLLVNKYSSPILFLLLIFAEIASAQNVNVSRYQYLSPVPGSEMILPEATIIIKEGTLIDPSTLNGRDIISVAGSISGEHQGRLKLSDDGRTIVFKPYKKFNLGESVFVKYKSGIFRRDGTKLPSLNFNFKICDRPTQPIKNHLDKLKPESFDINSYRLPATNINSESLEISYDPPFDYPAITLDVSNSPSPGYFFISPFTSNYTYGYLIILDNFNVPIYYQRMPRPMLDFKMQINGMLTYGDIATRYFYAIDSSYALVDSFSTGNGYATDNHDFQILPNGHSLLMAYDWQQVRMDTIVPGGDPNATVVGLIIQELDLSKDVVFQWRSWDHFLITDATEDVDLTAQFVDYVHGNAVELDFDGNLLLSSRHMDEITKISRQTGEIIWRWGGRKSRNNQFVFTNDSITFSHQHDIRRLPNGNVTLFDNGNLHSPKISRASEYKLDEINKTATLVWSYQKNPPTYSFGMGNMNRKTNGSSIICWGWFGNVSPSVTEVRLDGTVAFEISVPDSFVNYRAFKFPWRTNLFVTDPDSVFFESIDVGDSATTTVSIINHSSEELNITGFYNRKESYIVERAIPFTIPPLGEEQVEIKFKPLEEGYFKDVLHIRSDTEFSRIAQILILGGRTDSSFSTVKEENVTTEFKLNQNYPNPFNPSTVINFSLPQSGYAEMIIYDILGNIVVNIFSDYIEQGEHSITFIANGMSSGIYFYKLTAGDFSAIRKMIYLK